MDNFNDDGPLSSNISYWDMTAVIFQTTNILRYRWTASPVFMKD